MTRTLQQAQDRIDTLLTNAVAHKLNIASSTIVRRDALAGGATVPVFAVPSESAEMARALGLRVETPFERARRERGQ